MNYIKTYWGGTRGDFIVAIRTNCYNRALDHIQSMVAVLRTDHPNEKIDPEDVTIVIYDNNRFKGILGIEFSTKNPNKKYFKVDFAPCIS